MFRRILITCALVAGLPLVAWANLPIFKIAVTGDPAPDGGVFTGFEAPTADREETQYTGLEPLWFEATTSTGANGVYVYDAIAKEYFTLADTTMTVPQGGATFTGFSNVSSGFGELGFIATDSSGNQGVYAIGGFPLTLVATNQTLTPSGTPFGNFQSISIMAIGYSGNPGGEVESDAGIYDFGFGVPPSLLVANTSTPPPGASGPFTSFGPVSYKDYQDTDLEGGVQAIIRAVRATAGGVEGIYWGFHSSTTAGALDTSAPLVSLVNAGASVPDSNGNPTAATFTSFGNPVATSNEITFTAHFHVGGQDQQGIFTYGPYLDYGGIQGYPKPQLTELVATGQIAPDSDGATFTGFPKLTNGAFLASLNDGNEGLYEADLDPYNDELTLYRFLETGDILDGKTVSGIDLSPDGIGPLTFLVDFTDHSQGLYYLGVPEPGSLCLIGLPLVVISVRRRRSRRASSPHGSMIEPLEQRRLLSFSLVPIGVTPDADPTGATDAAPAINATILEVHDDGGGVVYLPDNPSGDVYATEEPLTIYSNVTVRGESAIGTTIDYIGPAGTAAMETAGGGAIQNLTIISDDGLGLTQQDSNAAAVGTDVENVKFETAQAAIDLPGVNGNATTVGNEGAQDSYFHDVEISVDNLDAGSSAIVIGGNNIGLDGVVIDGMAQIDYTCPSSGLVDINGNVGIGYPSLATILKDVTIKVDFGTTPVTDFNIYDASEVAFEDVWIQQNQVPSIAYNITDSDVTFDDVSMGNNNPNDIANLSLDSNDKMVVGFGNPGVWDGGYNGTTRTIEYNASPSIVTMDSLQIPSGAMSDYISLNDTGGQPSQIHLSSPVTYAGAWPTEPTDNEPQPDSTEGNNIALVPTEGIDVTQVSSPYTIEVGNHEGDEATETDNQLTLQSIIDNASGPVYLPAGEYDMYSSLDVPAGVTLVGVGGATKIWSDNPGDGVIDLEQTTVDGIAYDADNIKIADMALSNPADGGYGITVAPNSLGVNVDNLSVENVDFQTGTGVEQPDKLYTGNGGPGIYLPESQGTVSNSKFTGIGSSYGLFGSLVNIYGEGNTFEMCVDADGGDTYTGQYSMIISSIPDSTDPTNVLACDTERGAYDEQTGEHFDDPMYELSGPNIRFFASYIADNSSPGDVLLDGATNFQGDSFGGGLDVEDGSTADFRYADDQEYASEDSNYYQQFADPSNPSDSNVVAIAGCTSNVQFDVVRFDWFHFQYDGNLDPQGYIHAFDRSGVFDSALASTEFPIATAVQGSGENLSPAAVELGWDDVVIPSGGATTLTSGSTDPNQIAVTGASNLPVDTNGIAHINVISDSYPYIIGSSYGDDTLRVDWSAGLPAIGGSVFFNATGTGNKIVVNEPTDNQQYVTFVQGEPSSGLGGAPQDLIDRTFGLTDVQEIDTGSGSYNTVLDLSEGTPSGGIYYKGTGSTNTLQIEGSTEFNSFVVTSGLPSSEQVGISGVNLVTTMFMGQPYTLLLTNLGVLTSLAADSQANSLLDMLGDEGSPIYSVDMSNIGQIDFQLNAKQQGLDDADLNIGALPVTPNGYTYGFDSGGDLYSVLNLYGQGTQASPFIIGHSSITMDRNNLVTLNFAMFDGQINLYDSGLRGGEIEYDYSEGTPLNVNYVGNGNSLDVYAEGASSYTYSPVSYSNVSSVTFHGNDQNDTLSLPFYAGRGGSFGMPSYGITFNGGDGNDTVTINADSVDNTFEISGSNIIVDGDTSNPIVTIGVENVVINGGSEADTVTVDANTALNVDFKNGGSIDELNLMENGDQLTITAAGMLYGTGSSAPLVSFSGTPIVTLEGGSESDEVNVNDPLNSTTLTYSDSALQAYGHLFAISSIEEVHFTGHSVGDNLVVNVPNSSSSGMDLEFSADGGSLTYNANTNTGDTYYSYSTGTEDFLLWNGLYVGYAGTGDLLFQLNGGDATLQTGYTMPGFGDLGAPSKLLGVEVNDGSLALGSGGSAGNVISLSGLTVMPGGTVMIQAAINELRAIAFAITSRGDYL